MVVALGTSQQATTQEAQQEATDKMNQARQEAIEDYHAALGLGTDDDAERNRIRSRLAYLYFLDEDFYRAAVMAEFLALRYPESAGARQAAEIAVKAYRALYKQAPEPEEERTFETERMESIARYIVARWPEDPVADQARLMRFDTAIDQRDMDQAQQILAEITPDSAERAEAELRMGQALWVSYVREANKPEAERPPQATLDDLVSRAQKTLEQGISRLRKSVDQGAPVDYTLVYSVLSLAQICIGAGQSEEAVKWLDDPKIGPMTLAAANDPVTGRGNFRVETYKAALRAYVGAEQLEKAEEAMAGLEKLVAAGGDAAAAKKLTDIYVVLGQELQRTLKRLRQENKQEEAEKVVRGFEVFLKRISEQGETYGSLNWVAETFYNLGAGLESGGEEPSQQAKDYYKSAAATYVKILTKIREDKQFAPAGAEISSQVRLAACLRALGDHNRAMKFLVDILKNHEKRVDVQIEAARTFQDWGHVKGQDAKFQLAIKGATVDGRLLIWGWAGISRRVAPFTQYASVFHEARYNLALARKDLALAETGDERAKTLEQAEKDIMVVFQLYPKMGGDEWKAKYDALLKTIQRLRGKRPTGLPD
jgi:hypothetical protein